jgi:pimeloyl-ACP methyl ester carboxylesterase
MRKPKAPPTRTAADYLRAFGQAAQTSARGFGRKALELYDAVDPDVARHLAQLPLLSYTLLASRDQTIKPQEPDGYRPVIFVHGLGGTRGDFLPMAGFFWLQGRRRSYRIFFGRGQNISQMATALARFIRKVMKVTGERKVDIVAHSLGGVVSRLAVLDHGLSRNVAVLLTMGSPHNGTHSARYARTAITRDLRPDSALMRRLRVARWPSGVRGVSFWSRSDLLILPPESALVKGMRPVEMSPFTHFSYLIDPKSWAAVLENLE